MPRPSGKATISLMGNAKNLPDIYFRELVQLYSRDCRIWPIRSVSMAFISEQGAISNTLKVLKGIVPLVVRQAIIISVFLHIQNCTSIPRFTENAPKARCHFTACFGRTLSIIIYVLSLHRAIRRFIPCSNPSAERSYMWNIFAKRRWVWLQKSNCAGSGSGFSQIK